jgi:hypothetical protein
MEMKTIPFRARIAFLAVAAIGLQTYVLHQLSLTGLIDKLIPWDECAYIYIGISNVMAIKTGYWHAIQYAHSPLSIAPTTFAAFTAPQSNGAPYWINFVYLIGLFCFIGWALRAHRYASTLAFALVLVTTPFMFIFTSHIKTDFLGGMLLFVMLSLLFKPDDEPDVPLWIPAALSVLVITSKPMAFYMPILLAAAFVLSAFNRCLAAKRIDAAEIRRHGILIAVTIVAYAVLVLPNIDFFKAYIAQALSPMWASGKPLSWKLQFYLPFLTPEEGIIQNGMRFWGRNYLAYTLIFGGFIYTAGRSNVWRPALLLAAVAMIALIPIALSPQQQWSFGSQFAGAVFAVAFYMMRIVQRSRIAIGANWSIIAASAFVFQIPVVHLQSWIDPSPMVMSQAQAVTHNFVSRMRPGENGNPVNPSVFFTFSGPIPDFDFGIRYFRQYGVIPAGLSESYSVDQSIIDGGLGNYAYVVMLSDGSKLPTFVESNRSLAAYQEQIKGSWNLEEISRMPYGTTNYILYRVIGKKAVGT